MSLTLVGWILVVSLVAISALLIFLLGSRSARRKQLDLETCKARLEDIGAQLKLGKLNEAEADAARLALLSGRRSSTWQFGQVLRGSAGTLIVPVAVFLLVVGIGATISYVGDARAPEAARSGETDSGSDSELARLTDYTRSIGTEEPASAGAAGKMLPDVNTMIERLAARLETAPEDVKGWRMLGWSYFNTGRYEQAAAAYAKAGELDPSAADLKSLYEEAKAKASGSENSEAASSSQTAGVGNAGDGLSGENLMKSEGMPSPERDAAIRSMVDGLANRLESSPRDIEGWTRLMRSRVVLGEREVAATAFRRALDVFKDDTAASDKIYSRGDGARPEGRMRDLHFFPALRIFGSAEF